MRVINVNTLINYIHLTSLPQQHFIYKRLQNIELRKNPLNFLSKFLNFPFLFANPLFNIQIPFVKLNLQKQTNRFKLLKSALHFELQFTLYLFSLLNCSLLFKICPISLKHSLSSLSSNLTVVFSKT